MRLRHIEVFHAVMQAGTVSGAAHLLHVSQPAVTKVLQHCESLLGIVLFDRVRGKFYPTPEALRLFVEVDKLNSDLQAVRRLAASLKSGQSQSLRLAVTPALGVTVVPAAMTRWHEALPQCRCLLSTQHTRELVKALLLGEADLGLSLHDPRHPGIRTEALAGAPVMVLLPLALRAARESGPIHLRDLPAELIGLDDVDPLGNRVVAECLAHGVEPRMPFTVQTYQLARALAEAGIAATVVDPFTAASADARRVCVRALAPTLTVHLYLLTANNAPLSQPARRLVKVLGEAAQACLAPPQPGAAA